MLIGRYGYTFGIAFSGPMANPYLALTVLWKLVLMVLLTRLMLQIQLAETFICLPEERKEKQVLLICHQHFVTLLKHWKQMKWFRQALGNRLIYTNFLDARNMEWAAMLPLFLWKLITTWTFIKELNLRKSGYAWFSFFF